jgi:hypothetical protein
MRSMGSHVHALARLHRLSVGAALTVFAVLLAIVLGTGRAGAANQVTVLGAAAPAAPACPTTCQAIGKTTGFQVSIIGQKSPFNVPFDGRVVAWSIKLGAPSTKPNPNNNNQSDLDFFNKTFGGTPKARVSVLKPIMKKIKAGKPVYKLKSQSPVEDLSTYLGQTTTFTLDQPLKVKAGQVIALTIPTWAPAFAINQSADTVWQASRKAPYCPASEANIEHWSDHEALGSDRRYGCTYKTARLLYSATLVKDPGSTPPPKKPPAKK